MASEELLNLYLATECDNSTGKRTDRLNIGDAASGLPPASRLQFMQEDALCLALPDPTSLSTQPPIRAHDLSLLHEGCWA
jgi:hypothetical protein